MRASRANAEAPWHTRCSTGRVLASFTPRQLVVASFVIWCTCIGLGWAMATPLTGDEAAYALLARGRGDGWLYRPTGFVAFARLGAVLGDSELAVRLPSALVACTLIPIVAAVGGQLGAWRGAWAAAVIAGTHTFVLRAPTLLNDIPAAICVLGAIAVITSELDRDRGPRYRLVGVAPLFAAAFYLRYGSAPTIAIVLCAACVLWRREILRRPGPVIATAFVLAALLVPFLVYSQRTTGSVTGILTLAGEVAGRRYIGHGLVIYLISNPLLYHGVLVAPLALIGLVSIARPPRPHRRRARFLAAIAAGQILAIGLVSHANARFIFVAIILLVILGVDGAMRLLVARPVYRRVATRLTALAVRLPRLAPRLAALALRLPVLAPRIAAVAVVLAWTVMLVAIVPIHRHLQRGLAEVVAGGRAIRADTAGRPCIVVARAVPQIMWYSGCFASKPPRGITDVAPLAADRRWYTASVPRRGIDPAVVGHHVGAQPVELARGAWYLRPR